MTPVIPAFNRAKHELEILVDGRWRPVWHIFNGGRSYDVDTTQQTDTHPHGTPHARYRADGSPWYEERWPWG